ncbi:ExbD/TolR family protein [Humisphaera borealis]|uniref:Biopolymer transporter ExbD n=1 Tax=Humisphaera borealis TaxID=2807512 RepID=A0A7M2X285_9BACT|nr:biopolymer transporter ExbD [Humisphaera borealis]QOV91886.1 biopolymer transporter ExbD [Humisphaera borealis]
MRKTFLTPAHMHAGPNMTPLVDIVMVILIFLMLAGSFGIAEHTLKGKLPESPVACGPTATTLIDKLPTRIDIHVSRSTAGFDVLQLAGETVSSSEALTAKLKERHAQFVAAGSADEVEIVIRPTGDSAWAPVIATYDAALRAEFKKVNFAYAK